MAPAHLQEVYLNFTTKEVDFLSKTINLLSQSSTCHEAMVAGQVMQILRALVGGLSQAARVEVAQALAQLAATKQCREVHSYTLIHTNIHSYT
eukprot:CAMPEP_0173227228 /NCGR_PEP_ID=MMETSP1142-20121109/5851_1 /TAXON_ID=483371 /ORGANISM="non described non described, Strain CCMP2298" /LENGTH=92 /DNA_ID=CAMNT_0014155729 /DNA_START=202 /DNA_END=477 /DNA_ORIENTATION=+